MMTVECFGIAKDIVAAPRFTISGPALPQTVEELKHYILEHYPDFGNLNGFAIAINQAYASGGLNISETDEIVIIPPVSGG